MGITRLASVERLVVFYQDRDRISFYFSRFVLPYFKQTTQQFTLPRASGGVSAHNLEAIACCTKPTVASSVDLTILGNNAVDQSILFAGKYFVFIFDPLRRIPG